jgi:hypothetical protein
MAFRHGKRMGFYFMAWVKPMGFFRDPGRQEELATQITAFVRALASHLPLHYGVVHSFTDRSLGNDSSDKKIGVPDGVHEAYWLNVYGREWVESVGRQRVLSVPCWHLEELPGGGVLWLTRPTPADFDSEPARLAQARALVHLRPELEREAVLTRLRQRSLTFQPLEYRFHPDIAPLLQLHADHAVRLRLSELRKLVEHFNTWVPPEVSEWLPAHQAPPSDVSDPAAEARRYETFHAERLIALLHEKIPSLLKEAHEALPLLDYLVMSQYWPSSKESEKQELLIPMLGGYLGMMLVRHLGGRWVPRRTLEEAQVVVGQRAWLPFLRASHLLREDFHTWKDSSLTQLFLAASRLAAT